MCGGGPLFEEAAERLPQPQHQAQPAPPPPPPPPPSPPRAPYRPRPIEGSNAALAEEVERLKREDQVARNLEKRVALSTKALRAVADHAAAINDLRPRVASLEKASATGAAWREDVTKLQEQLARLESQCQEQRCVGACQPAPPRDDPRVAPLATAVERHEEWFWKVERRLRDHHSKIQQGQERLAGAVAAADLERQIEEVAGRIADQKVEGLRAEIQQQQQLQQYQQEEYVRLRKEFDEHKNLAEERVQTLEAAICKLHADHDQLKSDHDQLKTNLLHYDDQQKQIQAELRDELRNEIMNQLNSAHNMAAPQAFVAQPLTIPA